MRKLTEEPLFQDALCVLWNTMPVPDLSDAARAAIEAGRVRGYQQAMAVLHQLSVSVNPPTEMIEATYE